MSLTVKKAGAIFRARTGIMDPTPRKPYWKKSIWRCKFCNEKSQETKHYIKECDGTEGYFGDMSREQCWRKITTLEGDEREIKTVANIIQRVNNYSHYDIKTIATIIQRIINEINK